MVSFVQQLQTARNTPAEILLNLLNTERLRIEAKIQCQKHKAQEAATYASSLACDHFAPSIILLSDSPFMDDSEQKAFVAFADPLEAPQYLNDDEKLGLAIEQLQYVAALRHIEELRTKLKEEKKFLSNPPTQNQLIDAVNALASSRWRAMDYTPTQAYQYFVNQRASQDHNKKHTNKENAETHAHTKAVVRSSPTSFVTKTLSRGALQCL